VAVVVVAPAAPLVVVRTGEVRAIVEEVADSGQTKWASAWLNPAIAYGIAFLWDTAGKTWPI
jgi:hypothetical protein